MKRRSPWPILILPCILKTFWYMNTILQDYESVWHNIWPKNKCRSLWPIFHGPAILPYILKTVWCMNIILQDYESVWPDIWPQNKCRSLWPIFHGPVILPYILKTIWYISLVTLTYGSWSEDHHDLHWFCLVSWRLFDIWTPYFRIMSQYDTTFDLKINVGHYDLYFMVQRFCLISWRLFDIWTPYF